MRQYAYLKEPLKRQDDHDVWKIMLYETNEGIYLFTYDSLDAQQCASDVLYAALEDVHEAWDALLDDRGWITLDDPLPGCQHDAFLPIRVKGRDTGHPKWGQWEILQDGQWVPYDPER